MRCGMPGTRNATLIRAAITQEDAAPDLARIIACIDRTGGIEYTRDKALAESRAAVDALQQVPASPYREALARLAEEAVGRDR